MHTELYPGIAFSPQATLTDNIGAADTIIGVSDVSAFPPAPNLATIGTDEVGETILYTARTETALSGCQRGVEGSARAWKQGEVIGRNFTAKDHADLIAAASETREAAEAAQSAAAAAESAAKGAQEAASAAEGTAAQAAETASTAAQNAAQAAEDAETATGAAVAAQEAAGAAGAAAASAEAAASAAQEAAAAAQGTAGEALEEVRTAVAAKQDKVTGTAGQVAGFDKDGNLVPQAAPQGGVTSFNGRSGEVVPEKGDYTAADVGALAADGTAVAAKKLSAAQTIDGVAFDGTAAISHYGVCSTAASTAAKTVSLSGFALKTGARVAVKFTYANSAANPTLNVNNSGEKSICYADGKAGRGGIWGAGRIVEFFYDGTNWLMTTPSFAEGSGEASGPYSHAEGAATTAKGASSHAEGNTTLASGAYSHAEGYMSTASGDYSHAEGTSTTASGRESHAGGAGAVASGRSSLAYGFYVNATKDYSAAIGNFTKTDSYYQFVCGTCNTLPGENSRTAFIVGCGNTDTSRANCFRATEYGVYAKGNYNASGADYAELFEWADGNPDHADRCGLFVTLDGERIRLAGPEDGFILGIVSGAPSVVGDVYDDQWQGMFLTDIFGRPILEDVELPEELGPDGEVILPARTERRQKVNPAYDNQEKYLPRTQRPEWDAVGMLGKLVAVDDGSCQVNGWCSVGECGVATASAARTRYRVMARLDESHVRVLIL